MAQRYWTGTVDGIPLLDTDGEAAGFELVGAQAFDSGAFVKSITKAADGYPHELLTPAPYGQELELRFIHAPLAMFSAVLDSLSARNDAGEAFACTFTDGFQEIEASFKTGASPFYERGNPDGDYLLDAVLRLISTGA